MKIVRIVTLLAIVAGFSFAQDPFAPYRGFYVPIGDKEQSIRNVGSVVVLSASPEQVKGRVVPTQGGVYNFLSAHIANGKFEFKTVRVKTTAYEFQGKFLQAPPFPQDGKTVILEGTMKVYRNGTLAGESPLRLAKSDGGGE